MPTAYLAEPSTQLPVSLPSLTRKEVAGIFHHDVRSVYRWQHVKGWITPTFDNSRVMRFGVEAVVTLLRMGYSMDLGFVKQLGLNADELMAIADGSSRQLKQDGPAVASPEPGELSSAFIIELLEGAVATTCNSRAEGLRKLLDGPLRSNLNAAIHIALEMTARNQVKEIGRVVPDKVARLETVGKASFNARPQG